MEPFQVRIAVRGYELDMNGHLNQAVYLQYAEHARRECVRAAGIAEDKQQAAGVGPVVLETTIRFRRELRGGDEVDVSCEFIWGKGRPSGSRRRSGTSTGPWRRNSTPWPGCSISMRAG